MDHLATALPPQFPPSRPKLTQAEAGELVKFEANYPGELICEHTMPSLTFLSAVKDMKESDSYRWIPWKSRVSEQVQAQFNESRPPALLRSIRRLEDCETIDQPCNYIPTSGPGESHVIKFEHLFAIALAMVDAAHLLTLKRFNHKFQQLALAVPRDSALRPPSLCWTQIGLFGPPCLLLSLKTSLNGRLNEITICRQELQGLLQRRLNVAGGPTATQATVFGVR